MAEFGEGDTRQVTAESSTTNSFYEFAVADPDRTAITGDVEDISFGSLLTRVNRVSNRLRQLGLRCGDTVAALVHNDTVYWELVLATGQIGMYLVPINIHLTPREISYIVVDSEAKVLVAHADLVAGLTEIAHLLPRNRFVVGTATVDTWQPFDRLYGSEREPDDRSAGAVMGYTSGTTGHPKGVRRRLRPMSPERHATGSVRSIEWGLGSGKGVHLVCSPLYHSAPGTFATAALHFGHTIVCRRKFDPELVLRDIDRFAVTNVHMVPTHFQRLLRLPVPVRDSFALASMKVVVHAGAACPIPTKRRMIAWFGPVVWEYYGATESGLVSVVNSAQWLERPGTVGRSVRGVSTKILDADGRELPQGEVGLVYSHGHFEFEYHRDAEKTAAARVGEFSTAGDIGRLDDDGYLYILDRRSDLIISGGVNIYPTEIEDYLLLHPAVGDVGVVGVPDDDWGQSVLAVVQPVLGVECGRELVDDLLEHCREGLAPYKTPRRIEFSSALPRTDAGKLLRRTLRDQFAAQ
ncbi:AMP-binding protein [Rhodococcus globerulus]|uniref:AMP-binding protein n=1 Tax=Rhodococcus globerulus TaxID=33008 RepID=A0ABU4C4A5_RHOGO|nr:AMP-binding protein [Rhodococcus globerulus]MDV6271342.1 AMP-binding protein [Rhodococcus globerulus]